jgi:hypothetical protein
MQEKTKYLYNANVINICNINEMLDYEYIHSAELCYFINGFDCSNVSKSKQCKSNQTITPKPTLII